MNINAVRRAYELANDPEDVSDLPPMKVEVKRGERDVSSWRVFRPELDKEKCIGCRRCYILCPEVAIDMVDGKADINYQFCKGCGICVEECPVKAIDFVQETL
jgi:pyruvate ferredoxin oxidoreductase delta subunit